MLLNNFQKNFTSGLGVFAKNKPDGFKTELMFISARSMLSKCSKVSKQVTISKKSFGNGKTSHTSHKYKVAFVNALALFSAYLEISAPKVS